MNNQPPLATILWVLWAAEQGVCCSCNIIISFVRLNYRHGLREVDGRTAQATEQVDHKRCGGMAAVRRSGIVVSCLQYA